MKDALKSKLNEVLGKPILTEERVVYTLVQVRKLLDRCGIKSDNLKPIRFVCDWAVHIELDRKKGFATDLLEFVERRVKNGFSWDTLPQEDKTYIVEHFSLESIRTSMIRWLAEEGVCPTALGEIAGWYWFLRKFACVVADCPLKLKGGDLIEEVRFDIVEGNLSGTRLDLEWTFKRKDSPLPFRWATPTYFAKPDSFFGRNGEKLSAIFETQLREAGFKPPWDIEGGLSNPSPV